MISLPIFQIDAFAENTFQGNPAAVCPLPYWLDDNLLQSIAMENNLSETAFFVENDKGYELRWFTPADEVDLCGHATLAAADVIFRYYQMQSSKLCFSTRSGELIVEKIAQGLQMNFPASAPIPIKPPENLLAGLGVESTDIHAEFDYLVVLKSQSNVEAVQPNFELLRQLDKRGVIVTAPGIDCDFVSRCFYPKLAVDEDPVTGSAHCILAPFWAKKLQKSAMMATQLSSRKGSVFCQISGDRVYLSGQCVQYMKGEIFLPL